MEKIKPSSYCCGIAFFFASFREESGLVWAREIFSAAFTNRLACLRGLAVPSDWRAAGASGEIPTGFVALRQWHVGLPDDA